jgi:hypothetical protein
MNNIKIVRMQDGSDIIGIVNEILEGQYVIEHPMLVELYHKNNVSHISMAYYLPIELVDKNEVVLNSKDIVFITNPTSAFAEYYENSISKLESFYEESSALSEKIQTELAERIREFMLQEFNDLEVPKETILH